MQEDKILQLINTNFEYLKTNNVYEREKIAWSDFNYDDIYYTYMTEWISDRLENLDIIFGNTCVPISTNNTDFSYNKIILHPNPTQDILYLNSSGVSKYSITIVNQLGNVKLRKEVYQSKDAIITDDLENGLYLVIIEYLDKKEVHRLVIQQP